MTWGRSSSADGPEWPRYGPDPSADAGGSPRYGPDPTHDHGAGAPAGPSPTYGPPAGTPAYGPSPSFGTWPAAPDPAPHGYGTLVTQSDPDWSPAPIRWTGPVATRERCGQGLAWTVLVLAVVVAAVLGIGTYVGLATLRVTAPDPWDTAWNWLTLCGAAAVAAVLVLVLGVVALVVARPKRVAALATALAVVLPVVALYVALTYGVAALARHAAMDTGALITLLTTALDRLGAAAGPVRDVLAWLLRLVGGQV